eukprot:jgi/Bigna1/86465/estExt_fgenesh1_pg.C_100305
MDAKDLDSLRKAVEGQNTKSVRVALNEKKRFKGFHPCHLIPVMKKNDWVFSKKSPLLEDLKKHISAKTTGKLKAVREDLKLQWPRFLEDEKGEEVGYTPLHIACMFGSRESINGLFEAGANSKDKTKSGWNAVELASYRSGMLDLQYDVTSNFFHAVHLDLLRKFTKGSVLDIKGMKEYLKDKELNEWVELLDDQYGQTRDKKNKNLELEYENLMKEVNKKIDQHTEDQHKIDALPDLDEIYTLDEEFSEPSEEKKEGGPVDSEENSLTATEKPERIRKLIERRSSIAMIQKRQNVFKYENKVNQKTGPIIKQKKISLKPFTRKRNSKKYLISDRPLCDNNRFQLGEDYKALQRLYMKLEEERERRKLEFQHQKNELENELENVKKELENAKNTRSEGKKKKCKDELGKESKKGIQDLKKLDIEIYTELAKIFMTDKKDDARETELSDIKDFKKWRNRVSEDLKKVKETREQLATETAVFRHSLCVQNTMLLLITIVCALSFVSTFEM